MPNIYDNLADQTRLRPALREALEEYDTFDVATGYLDLRGWSSLADLVDAKSTGGAPTDPIARILVGMVAPSDSQQILDSLQHVVDARLTESKRMKTLETNGNLSTAHSQ